ncbi:MAG: DUF1772 domain-containing protein [Alphaproteobacteria bacterium]|nr:DUF1772 domain-containing protein [Alphaproteobacteria bacterium]
MIPAATTTAQVLALVLVGLLVGAMFGIWRGYDPTTWSAATFVEAHQGAVRGLNTLLPAMGLATMVLLVFLAFFARAHPGPLWLYLATLALMVVAGLITRFGNQPLNEIVMGWTADAVPQDWAQLRGTWWMWHLARLAAAGLGGLALIAAVFSDRAA